jgi:hypothetical protein
LILQCGAGFHASATSRHFLTSYFLTSLPLLFIHYA